MTEAREASEWERASWLMALTFNLHRNPKKSQAKKPRDFNPTAASKKEKAGTVSELNALLGVGKK